MSYLCIYCNFWRCWRLWWCSHGRLTAGNWKGWGLVAEGLVGQPSRATIGATAGNWKGWKLFAEWLVGEPSRQQPAARSSSHANPHGAGPGLEGMMRFANLMRSCRSFTLAAQMVKPPFFLKLPIAFMLVSEDSQHGLTNWWIQT